MEISDVVNERLEIWNKIATNEQKCKVKEFCGWLGKSEEFIKVLPLVELGSFIAVKPRTKILKEKLEKLTGETITIAILSKQTLPDPKELLNLLNGNNNH